MKTGLLLLLIFLCGLGLRVDAAWTGAAEDMPDSVGYQQIARGLAEDGTFSQKGAGGWAQAASNYSPGLPLFLGGLSYLTGVDDPQWGRVLLALLGAGAIPIAFMLGRRLRGDGAGLIAASVVAFYPTLISDSGMILSEGLGGTLLAGALLAALVAERRGWLWVFSGVLFALAALVRPDFLLLGLLLTLLFLWKERSARPLLLFAAMFLCLLPWSVYASIQAGHIVPLSTGGGQTLFTGSVLETDGDPQKISDVVLSQNPQLLRHPLLRNNPPPPGEEMPADQVLTALALWHAPKVSPNETLSRLGREEYVRALSRPAEFLPFMGQKLERTWLRGRKELTGNISGHLFHLAIVFSALAGLLFLRRSSDWSTLATVVLASSLVALLLVASPRRVLAIWPVVATLAGGGAIVLAEQIKIFFRRGPLLEERSVFAFIRSYLNFR